MSSERRRSPRFVLHQLIEVEFDRETFIPASGLDLSAHGLGCKTQIPLGLYTRVYLLFQLRPGDEASVIEAEGQVLRCQPQGDGTYRIGIEFRGLPEQSLQRIREWGAQNGAI